MKAVNLLKLESTRAKIIRLIGTLARQEHEERKAGEGEKAEETKQSLEALSDISSELFSLAYEEGKRLLKRGARSRQDVG